MSRALQDQRPLATNTIALPAAANPAGAVVGGLRMAQTDLAAGNVAVHRARRRSGRALRPS